MSLLQLSVDIIVDIGEPMKPQIEVALKALKDDYDMEMDSSSILVQNGDEVIDWRDENTIVDDVTYTVQLKCSTPYKDNNTFVKLQADKMRGKGDIGLIQQICITRDGIPINETEEQAVALTL